ncbi:MAG: complex I subunit 1 family protein [Candidatus Bathyarchaeia archaeon]
MDAAIALLISFPTAFIISLLFDGVDRKLHARMQRRIGPPIIQPFFDIVKLFSKERIVPATASTKVFETMPMIAAASSLLGASIVLSNILMGFSIVGDLILVMYLLAMSSIALMIGGSGSGNPYGAIGFSRKMSMMIAYEVPMLLAIISIAFGSSPSLAIDSIIKHQVNLRLPLAATRLSMVLAAIAFLLCMPAAASVVPFDIPEAKTEIIYGFLVEYGGPYLAIAKIAKVTSNFALTLLTTAVFFFVPSLLGEGVLLNLGILLSLCLAISLLIMFATITVPRTVLARLRIGQALKFYWILPLTLSLSSITLSAVGL